MQRLGFLLRAVLGPPVNNCAFVKGGTYINSGLKHSYMRTNIVHPFEMTVPPEFEVLVYLTAIVHVDGMINNRKVKKTRMYVVGTRIGIVVSIVSRT